MRSTISKACEAPESAQRPSSLLRKSELFVSSPDDAGKQKVTASSRFEANDSAAHAEAVRERSAEQETLHLGAVMTAKAHGLSKKQFLSNLHDFANWLCNSRTWRRVGPARGVCRLSIPIRSLLQQTSTSTSSWSGVQLEPHTLPPLGRF